MKEVVLRAKEAGLSERRACVLLDVSRAGVRKPASGAGGAAEVSDERSLVAIRRIYPDNWGSHGSPRVHGALGKEGIHMGQKRVARLMREHHIVASCKRTLRAQDHRLKPRNGHRAKHAR